MEITIRNISFSYDKTPILKNIDISIEKGSFTAFVGPNGSGKSTLIKCIIGFLKPQKGELFIKNKELNSYNSDNLSKTIAYVPQSEALYGALTVYETVLMGRKPYIAWSPGKNDHSIVIRVLKMLDLEDIAERNINELSGGQKQRAFIARALTQEPQILLLDEPTANLDLKHTIDVLKLLEELALKGITVVIAIHDLNMAIRHCSKVVMINSGTIFAHGGKEIITESNIKKLYDVNVRLINTGEHILFVPEE